MTPQLTLATNGKTHTNGNGVNRIPTGSKHLQWVRVDKIRISPRAQREQKPWWYKEIANNFDPDRFDVPHVNRRTPADDAYWCFDGGHRIMALNELGWADQQVQCWVYEGLAEQDEADLFLHLNNRRNVNGMEKFKVAVVAGREMQCDIDRIARAAGLSVGTGPKSIRAVAALEKVYAYGPGILSLTLRLIRDAYGLRGFESKIITGIGLFAATYVGAFEESRVINQLTRKMGGVTGLLGDAERIKSSHGVTLSEGVAAATVETYNSGRGGKKLPKWWEMRDNG